MNNRVSAFFSRFWRKEIRPVFAGFSQKKKLKNWLESLPERKLSMPGQQHLLIIRTDDIGDYVLFRPALELVYRSQKFKDWKITVLGNQIWRELALELDRKFVSDWIWLNKAEWFHNAHYRASLLSELSQESPELVWIPARTRHFFLEDTLARAFYGIRIITSGNAFCDYPTPLERMETEALKYEAQEPDGNPVHEITFNQGITNRFTQTQISFPGPVSVPSRPYFSFPFPKYWVLFPGASAPSKRWPVSHFANLVQRVEKQVNLPLVLAGSSSDSALANAIIEALGTSPNRISLCGKTSLPELLSLVSGARLLVSNDTSAAHLAAIAGTPTLALCNGNKWGRFFPYPPEFSKVTAFFPSNSIPLFYSDRLPISDISPEVVASNAIPVLQGS